MRPNIPILPCGVHWYKYTNGAYVPCLILSHSNLRSALQSNGVEMLWAILPKYQLLIDLSNFQSSNPPTWFTLNISTCPSTAITGKPTALPKVVTPSGPLRQSSDPKCTWARLLTDTPMLGRARMACTSYVTWLRRQQTKRLAQQICSAQKWRVKIRLLKWWWIRALCRHIEGHVLHIPNEK